MRGYAALAERLRRSTVQVVNGAGGGSGVVWDANGVIVTNAHVVRGDEACIIGSNGRQLRARVTKRDRERDLAILQTATQTVGLTDGGFRGNLEPAAIGDSSSLRTGQIVVAIGNPLGVTAAIAAGVIHTIGPLQFGPRHNWIQADVRLAPGNSGGLLADAEGRVIGINTMIFHGLGLAIPSNEVCEFVRAEPNRARAHKRPGWAAGNFWA